MSSLQSKHNNPLNSSTSKQQYSFSKKNRFATILKTEGVDVFYQIPSTRAKVAFSFGKSGRYQYGKCEKTSHSPPPGSYDLEGEIDKMIKHKSGFKFLYGREQCKSGNVFKTVDTPGPGEYHPNPEVIQKKLIKDYTLGKLPSSRRLVQEPPLPGPGAYPINSLILNQHKILSNQKKTSYGKLIFPKIKSERIRTEASSPQIRWPQVTAKGEKLIQNKIGFSLSKSPRFQRKQFTEPPGPGTYQKFSQFIENQKK